MTTRCGCLSLVLISVKIMVSPMLRALETASFVLGPSKKVAQVRTELAEVGGVYSTSKVTQGGVPFIEKHPGKALSKQSIEANFPAMFDTSMLVEEGPWDAGRGFESITQSITRSNKLCAWLRSPGMHQEVKSRIEMNS